ncbi:hypothetical protein Q1695_009573 [Nippostrongylus brasiliensis]|nr:hypothetical protein Q1695_009573 [Nippostrongylus brasiliensis]
MSTVDFVLKMVASQLGDADSASTSNNGDASVSCPQLVPNEEVELAEEGIIDPVAASDAIVNDLMALQNLLHQHMGKLVMARSNIRREKRAIMAKRRGLQNLIERNVEAIAAVDSMFKEYETKSMSILRQWKLHGYDEMRRYSIEPCDSGDELPVLQKQSDAVKAMDDDDDIEVLYDSRSVSPMDETPQGKAERKVTSSTKRKDVKAETPHPCELLDVVSGEKEEPSSSAEKAASKSPESCAEGTEKIVSKSPEKRADEIAEDTPSLSNEVESMEHDGDIEPTDEGREVINEINDPNSAVECAENGTPAAEKAVIEEPQMPGTVRTTEDPSAPTLSRNSSSSSLSSDTLISSTGSFRPEPITVTSVDETDVRVLNTGEIFFRGQILPESEDPVTRGTVQKSTKMTTAVEETKDDVTDEDSIDVVSDEDLEMQEMIRAEKRKKAGKPPKNDKKKKKP